MNWKHQFISLSSFGIRIALGDVEEEFFKDSGWFERFAIGRKPGDDGPLLVMAQTTQSVPNRLFS
jgi:hypothetical protein